MKAKLDSDKLVAAGMEVTPAEGGVFVRTKTMKRGQFVPMEDGLLVLVPERSSLHRQINGALGGINPSMPGNS